MRNLLLSERLLPREGNKIYSIQLSARFERRRENRTKRRVVVIGRVVGAILTC